MKRTQSFAVLLTLLAAAQAPAVFIDNFDSLSPEWQFRLGENSSNLVYEVSGGQFRAFGFTPAPPHPTHSNSLRRLFSPDPQTIFNNLTLKTSVSLPLTANVNAVAFSIYGLIGNNNPMSTRQVIIERFGAGHSVTLIVGSVFTTSMLSGLPSQLDIEVRNQGPVASLFLNGSLASTVTGDDAFDDTNPNYRVAEIYFAGDTGTSAPVNIDYIQVVPEPTTLAGLGIASLVATTRSRKVKRQKSIR